jgi:hypothetical protein
MLPTTFTVRPTSKRATPRAPRSLVLLVNANPETRALYGDALRLAGCGVVDVVDGREALIRTVQRPLPDLGPVFCGAFQNRQRTRPLRPVDQVW